MKLEISRHIFQKCSPAKFHENVPGGNRGFARGWTDRQTYRETWRN